MLTLKWIELLSSILFPLHHCKWLTEPIVAVAFYFRSAKFTSTNHNLHFKEPPAPLRKLTYQFSLPCWSLKLCPFDVPRRNEREWGGLLANTTFTFCKPTPSLACLLIHIISALSLVRRFNLLATHPTLLKPSTNDQENYAAAALLVSTWTRTHVFWYLDPYTLCLSLVSFHHVMFFSQIEFTTASVCHFN